MSPSADQNGTTLRCLFYPPVNRENAKEGQLRCGEHSDYGSITLLFQGSDGLQVTPPLCHTHVGSSRNLRVDPHVLNVQVRSRSGEFISVPIIPGAVLVNIADLMQRWTSDHFVSAVSSGLSGFFYKHWLSRKK